VFVRGASFDKNEFKINLAGSVSYPLVYTVEMEDELPFFPPTALLAQMCGRQWEMEGWCLFSVFK
jgi:hypothetical protein